MERKNYVTEDDDGYRFEFTVYKKYIYTDYNRIMVSRWGTDSCFNHEKIKIGDIEIMTSAYGLSGLSGSRLRYKYIVYNTYVGRRSNFN